MLRLALIAALLCSGQSAFAEDSTQAVQRECQSCNARHKGLQKLQARKAAEKERAQTHAAPADAKKAGETIAVLPPSTPSDTD